LDYAKNYLEIPVIYAIIKEENRISEGILRKFGFTYEKQGVSNLQKVSVYKKELTE
jgi:RimJ/RimL family protein N-acetyltransferase